MALSSGTRLGPYEIVAPLGAGGMGEVYRARDVRLGREVAVKVLPAPFAADGELRSRFEREARAASALNHPNIVTVHDVGSADSVLYVAMELVDGRTVRELLSSGPLPTRKLLGVAVQVADGLAKAHAAGIVHRDLKPENLIVSKDGFVKILDFGLAKLVRADDGTVASPSEISFAETGTGPGTILGTVGYMSPEQASGRVVDFRSDQFSLGSILYEMATGRRAFQRGTPAESLAAIIREEPPPIAPLNPALPAPLSWTIERCLAKDPDERYASTRDLARDLRSLKEHLSEPAISGGVHRAPARPSPRKRAAVVILAILALGASWWLGRRTVSVAQPSFKRLTFRRGSIGEARLAPDGHTIVYGAAWDADPARLFSTRPESPQSMRLPLPDAQILSISPSGEMAVLIGPPHVEWQSTGTLARVPLSGGAPRDVLAGVHWADWTPDGQELAVVRDVNGKARLELPVGNVVYETSGWISHVRVSPGGDLIAFLDHPAPFDQAGSVAVVDRHGRRTTLSRGWAGGVEGLAWSPGGDEVWFTASRTALPNELHGVSLSGRERIVWRAPGVITLRDVSRDGHALIAQSDSRVGITGLVPGDPRERDLSWLDWSTLFDLSPDGRTILFNGGGGEPYATYVRKTDGSPAVRLGEGQPRELSPDGAWALVLDVRVPRQMVLLPTGAGEPRRISHDQIDHRSARFLPDGKRIAFSGTETGRGVRLYLQDVEDGTPRALTPEGFEVGPISPDGTLIAGRGPGPRLYLVPVGGGPPHPVADIAPEDRVAGWSADGRTLLLFHRLVDFRVERLDVATGRKSLWKEIEPPDRAGVMGILNLSVTPDGASYAYSYWRMLSDLYLVDGLK